VDGFPDLSASGGATTLYELFQNSAKKFATEKCLGYRPIVDGVAGDYKWFTYAEVAKKVDDIASGVSALGLKKNDRVGVYGPNCVEWMIAMQACNRMNYECVPLYDSLGDNAIEYIIDHSESVLVFVDTKKLPMLAKAISKTGEQFKHVVYWGPGDEAAIQAIKGKGLVVESFDELQKQGAATPAAAVPPKPDDYCTIMYTSGTTGDPKGVLLKHSAVVASVASLTSYLEAAPAHNLTYGPGDVILSYLPLAHIFDRVSEEMILYSGGAIAYWQGDVNKLVEDIGAAKPTLFIGVPRVYDRIYNRVMDQINTAGGVKKMLFNWGVARKLWFLKQGAPCARASPFFDRLVFSKVKQRLGGRVRVVVSGGAPLAPHVEEFLRVAFCCPVVQGYGLTETCAASCIALPDVYPQFATNGPVTPGTELRLESVPEMNYDATKSEEPAGEVLLRGPQLFSGYYKAPDKTVEVLDADGWFHTGDIGMITTSNGLKIIDRKKNIFKLSQGEYVAVEKVEATYKKVLEVEQVWVYGNSFKSCLVAVVVPKKNALMDWAKGAGKTGTFEELCKDPEAATWVLDQLKAQAKADKLKGFEVVKKLLLDPEPFSVENELLTPTFKFKRPQLQKKYQADIDAMYKALNE